jgi:ABC-type amino acid transport system permease subunit
MDDLVRDHANAVLPIFLAVAGGYMVITLGLSRIVNWYERRTATS